MELHQRLGWDKEVGSHHDQLWKMFFKGLMLDNWVTVLGDLGIKSAMLQQVEVGGGGYCGHTDGRLEGLHGGGT